MALSVQNEATIPVPVVSSQPKLKTVDKATQVGISKIKSNSERSSIKTFIYTAGLIGIALAVILSPWWVKLALIIFAGCLVYNKIRAKIG